MEPQENRSHLPRRSSTLQEKPNSLPNSREEKFVSLTEKEAQHRRSRYEALIREHEASLIRSARRLCAGDEDHAQDLVQDAFIRGYKAFLEERFIEGTNARAWFAKILVNGFLSDHRRDKWKAGANLDLLTANGESGPVETHVSPTERPDTALLVSVLEEPIERAMASLPEGQRLCVWLVDVEEWEYAEVAEALKIPIGTVRSRLSSARLKLHSLLLEYARTIRKVKE